MADPAYWTEQLRRTLACYDEPLLRQVASRLVRPRNQWPAEELIERSLAITANPAQLDRRLQELEPASRKVLALIGHSRQPAWSLGNLVEMLFALGHTEGLQPIFALLEAGLLYPLLHLPVEPSGNGKVTVRSFDQWLGQAGAGGELRVFAVPLVARRVIGEDLGLPDLSAADEPMSLSSLSVSGRAQEADGLEWLLRLAVFWQQVAKAPLRRTQQGGFFKRDHERLTQDPLLNGAPAERLAVVPDAGLLVAALAEQEGMLCDRDGESQVGTIPQTWEQGLTAGLEALWLDLFRLSCWNPRDGWRGDPGGGNPFPSAYLLAFLLLARLPEEAWARPASLETWLTEQHPYWQGESMRPSRLRPWLETFLLGVAYHLRLVQARWADDAWLVRLAPLGRWLLGLAEEPRLDSVHTQTLLVQPNLEIIAYRQGLTAGLISRLTQVAAWKSLGAACTLQLEPETVYRALESGQTFEGIRLTLEQHATRAIPPAVLDSLRTWANKRDRITVYPSATLMEFSSAEDLNEALARGLPATRISDTLAVVASEEAIEYRHFRLAGTRDYALPPEKCVLVEDDGVTLAVDLARADLLLETELPRFAELLPGPSGNGQRQYRLTPQSLTAAREQGLTLPTLETWFVQRTGEPLPPAARLLLTADQTPAPRLQRHLVLEVASPELADGLWQWPATRELLAARLGPTALVVPEDQAEQLRQQLREAGIRVAES
jgi:hypothetical protein